jgi:hypothetical protein
MKKDNKWFLTAVRLIGSLAVFWGVLFILAGCTGGGNDEISGWIVPQNISGIWVATFPVGDDWTNPMKLQEYRFAIEENIGIVSGDFEEFYYDGKYFSYPISGSFNSTNGYLTISHNSHLYGFHTEIFRFTSDALMYAINDVNHDLPRYECVKINEP